MSTITFVFFGIFCAICVFLVLGLSERIYRNKLVKLETKVGRKLNRIYRQFQYNEVVRNEDREFFINEISKLYDKIEELERTYE